jgi:hypothetical protein
MAKVWVQVWTAKVPGSVEVEESDLRQVQGLESLKKMVPMLVKETAHSEWAMVADWSRSPLVSVEETVEVLPPLELVQDSEMEKVLEKEKETREKALAKGWGWVLGLEGHPNSPE